MTGKTIENRIEKEDGIKEGVLIMDEYVVQLPDLFCIQ